MPNKNNNFLSYIKKANKLVNTKKYKEAIDIYKKAIKIDNKNKKLFFNISVAYLQIKEYHNAKEYLLKAIEIDVNYTTAYINLGIVYKRLKQYNKAFEILSKVLKSKPNDIDTLYNFANTLSSLEQYNKAIKYFDKVLDIDKNYYKAYYAKGLVYNHLLDYNKAFKLFKKTLELKPNYADASFAISLIQLRFKNYKDGWINYEHRWEANNPLKKMTYNVPFYNGEDLTNKTILIQEEQGFGDNIQFIRYIEYLKKQNPKKIYVAVRQELVRLFSLILDIIIVTDQDILVDVDYFISLLSCPRIFKTTFETIPNKIPYLPIPKKDNISNKIIKKNKKLKIGFAYQGNLEHSNDKYRSIPIEIFKTLFELKDIDFYSLQIPNDKKVFNSFEDEYNNIYNCATYIEDFYDSAVIIDKLDIIISIDSALAHFAGALGKKVFILLPKNVEWRWFENIDYSPWYPTAKLFRQKTLGLWGDVLEEVKANLI
jgi:tetratricopeptide (TPR) repeat protein